MTISLVSVCIYAILGIFVSGCTEILKWSFVVPFVRKERRMWVTRALLAVLCVITFTMAWFLRNHQDHIILLLFLYCFSQVAYTHIFMPLSKKYERGS